MSSSNAPVVQDAAEPTATGPEAHNTDDVANESTLGERFIVMLNQREMEEELLRRSSICLTPTRLTRLTTICAALELRLASEFSEKPAIPTAAIERRGSLADFPVGDGAEQEAPRENEVQTPINAEASRGTKRSRSPIQPILNLTELHCPESISAHIARHGRDARSFLTMENDFAKRLPPEINARQGRLGPHFLTIYYYTLSFKDHMDASNIIWCFSMLFYFDLVKYICPRSKGKVGALMKEDISKFFDEVPEEMSDREILQENLNKWSLVGKKVDHLCSEFGEGCLFYLGNIVTPHFLQHRFTMKGKYWVQAKRHLHHLDIKKKANESHLTQLGRDTRKMLIGGFAGLNC